MDFFALCQVKKNLEEKNSAIEQASPPEGTFGSIPRSAKCLTTNECRRV